MSDPIGFLRCSCGEEWRHTVNIMDDEPVWIRPKVKRGGCTHDVAKAEAFVSGKWVPMVPPADGGES